MVWFSYNLAILSSFLINFTALQQAEDKAVVQNTS